MLKTVEKHAKTEEAKLRVNFANYKDYEEDEWCASYFGMFVEWLSEHWLNHYGPIDWNIHGVNMNDSVGNINEDYGVDGEGLTLAPKKMASTGRMPVTNSPVYIQVKGVKYKNRGKEHQPNDGSRLPNFCTNAMATAMRNGHAYQARYIVFTTAKGIHYSTDKMSREMIEVIGHKDISKAMDDDIVFLNILRKDAGLPLIPVSVAPMDAEAVMIHRQLGVD